jgi:hypothetical protein
VTKRITADRLWFAAALGAPAGEAVRVITGASLGRAGQVEWLICTIMWVAVAFRFNERLKADQSE